MEEWKAILGTNGKIEISNEGRVRSLLRGKPYILKCQEDNKGYLRLRITINRKKITYKIHREVAKAFIPNINHLPQINHKDGDKKNNNAANLEWVSNKENANHAIQNGLWDSVIEGSKKYIELTKKPIIAEKDGKIIYFSSINEAEKVIGTKHINDVIKGKRNHALGWKFKYADKEVMPCLH